MGSVNIGNQSVYFRYKQELISSDLGKLLHNLIQPGVYSGGNLLHISGDDITIAPLDVVCYTSANQFVHIKTQDTVPLEVDETTPYITCQFTWVDSTSNYMDFTAKAFGSIGVHDVVIGKAIYEASVITGFDYSEKTLGFNDKIDILEKRLPAGIVLPNMMATDPALLGYRILPLNGAVLDISDTEYTELVENVYCGDANNATAPAFYKTSDAGGVTRDITGTYLVFPNSSGLSLKNIGDAIISGRTKTGPAALGEVQEDQMQGHTHGATQMLRTPAAHNASYPSGNDTGLVTSRTAAGDILTIMSDGTNDTPRTGLATRDSTMGTIFGITY